MNEESAKEVVDQSEIVDVDEMELMTLKIKSQAGHSITYLKLTTIQVMNFSNVKFVTLHLQKRDLIHNWCPQCYSTFDSILTNYKDLIQLVIMYWKSPAIRLSCLLD